MKKTKIAKWVAGLGTGLAFLFTFLISTGGGALSGLLNKNDATEPIVASAAGEDPNYGALVDGNAYYFTDKSRIDGFRAGTDTSDTSNTVVQSSAAHGSAENPFVINTVAQWTHFAGDTTNATNANVVFVLGADLDFGSTAGNFTPVPSLSAKFYGANHKLKNITHDFGGVTGNYGAFCVVTANAVVADVSLDNVNMTGAAAGAAYNYSGTLIGDNLGASVLNCHAKGSLSGTHSYYNASSNSQVSEIGGLMGSFRIGSGYVYRCSVDVTLNVSISTHGGGGGIIGNINQGSTVKIYDCFAIVNWVASVTVKNDMYFAGLAGLQHNRDSVCTVIIENCVNYMKITYTGTINITLDGSTISGYGNMGTKITFNNIYTSGDRVYNANTAYSTNIFGSAWYVTEYNSKVVSGGNYNWYAQNVSNISTNSSYLPAHLAVAKGIPNTQYNGTNGTRSDLYEAAKNSTFLSSKIWVNKKVIDEAYMTNTDITSTAGYTIENSPVRNPLVVRVSYYENINNIDKAMAFDGITQPVIMKAGESLARPAERENREFVGWTTNKKWTADKMGTDEAPFTSMPATLIGDNKLYAVWRAKTSSAAIGARLGSKTLTYDATDGFTGEYDGTGIVLSAELTVKGMADPDISYQWERDGDKIETDGTAKDYTVKFVKDNDKYSVELNYTSKSEPLFFGKAYSDEKQVNMLPVDPSNLTIRSVKLPTGTHAYVGADLEGITPTGILLFGSTQIDAEIVWDNANDRFGSGSSDSTLVGDKETRKILFKPDAKYGGNYGTNIPYEFTYTVEYLQFTFHLTGFGSMDQLTVDLKYGDNYAYSKIADLFEEAMAPHMSRLGGKAPVFRMLDGDEYPIAEFRTKNKTFENVSDPAVLQITVRFAAQSHTVSFDPNGGTYEEGAEAGNQTVRYGNCAAEPTVPPANEPLLFLGWFYWTKDDDGRDIEVQWDFANDYVTRDLELHAVWLAANKLDRLTADIAAGAVFNAGEAIDKTKLTVSATFSGTRNGATVVQTVVLSPAQYTLEYYNSDGTKYSDSKLHVTDDGSATRVVIKYVNDGTVTDDGVTAELRVNPKKILLDTEELIRRGYFGNATVEIDPDGNPISLTITAGRVSDLFGPYLDDDDVEYAYSLGGREVPQSSVTGKGEYTVTARFKPLFPDYEAPDISATLKIVTQKETLTVTWGETEFVFNNKVQVPVPTFTVTLENGTVQEIKNVNYRLEGDTDAKTVGNNYYVDLILTDTGYKLADGFEGTSFVIKKAKVAVPTQIEALDYIGEEYDLNDLPEEYKIYFEGLDTDLVTVTTNAKGTNAGAYTAYVTLKDTANSEWDGVTGVRQQMTWEIRKAQLSVFWGNEHRFDVDANVPSVVYFVGLMEGDMDEAKLSDLNYVGDTDMSKEGSHTLTVSLKTSEAWTKNYQLDDSKSFTFVVANGEGDVILVYIDWGDNKFVYSENNWQGPSFTLRLQEDGTDVTELLKNLNAIDIENGTNLWAGSYEMKVSLDSASGYYLYGKTSYNYTISKDKDGEGTNPDALTPDPGGDDKNDNKGNTGNEGNGDTLSIPLWQVIVSGVCTVLFVVCFAKSYSNLSKAKAAKNEAKELAAQSYAVNYGFAPLPLLAVGPFLGMGETPWTIIAFVTLGVFLVSLAAMLLTSKKRKAAELALKREQARVAEEKEYAREEAQRLREEQARAEMREEQARRDNEMKMMFAAMQQNYQPPMYDDSHMQNMIASTISALLPAMQQQMALPPAQSDASAYAAPSGMPAEAQNEINRLHAQMAQQQELLNQLLQNQQAQQAYEEEPVDDISWLGESDEVISLEESYGALGDEGRRAYYDIGSYIMSKPRTSQNDGRYAVLFKYRGRTIFKLCIKDDAPVLYYPAGNGKAEVRVADASSLEVAKSVIDRTVMSVDGQM